METFFVQLSSVADVKQFVDAATCMPFEIDVRSGRYLVNGKSIMGLLSVDLAGPIQIEVHGTSRQAQQLKDQVSRYVVQK